MRSARARSRGVSVLDLLTATALSATVLATAVPNLRTLRMPFALSGAARQVAADLQGARQRAIARNARYRVTFTAPGSYVLERETAPGSFTPDGGVQKLPSGATLGTVTPGNPIFDTRGMLTGTVTVPVSTANGKSRTVTMNVLGQTTIS